ncbi:endonuclease VII domain-containing protein [Verrucosispora sp. WMMA2044]|uniref:Recombinase n=1 Tax=Verrucosispora sioxanthis TaxID=2499994 RepID=A0A6M1L341_9ACTN|nr:MULTISPECIES: endonuclease VII domain-containing protein [Micromonospora]NEE63917.1 recombinase [Verrucosispora sioxanthis]NGM13027.1 recombinase [Verrucosispora sioxanthis]WBB50990.1 endonuclease VII domain-containing protein [Verrucosispora sp. WMMA2044]
MSNSFGEQHGQRRCRDCGEWKALEEFCANSKRPSGRGSYCKPCFNARSKASYAKRVKLQHGREVKPVREVAEGHRYCADCGSVKPLIDFPRNRADSSGYATYCKPCHNTRTSETKQRLYGGNREYHLRRRYGIGQREFDELLAEQGGLCAVCGDPDPEHVDHDHRTGWVRGILCFNCNGGLGQFRDSPTRLARAVTYLRGTTWQRVLIHPGVFQMCSPTRGRPPSRHS